MGRQSLEETWQVLERWGLSPPRDADGVPIADHRPEPGHVFGGLRLRDLTWEEADRDGLTLPRSWLERCRCQGVSFANTDLKMCRLENCDFLDCDFSGADLLGVEVIGCHFFACNFHGARLIGADFLGAALSHCVFTNADLTGTKLPRSLKEMLPLTEEQRRLMVNWQDVAEEESQEKERPPEPPESDFAEGIFD